MNTKHLLGLSFLVLLVACRYEVLVPSPVDAVNPLMGTASTFAFSHGNTYPAVAVPWGMNFWSPQTGENGSGWMYAYADSLLRIQADPPAQPVDKRLRHLLDHAPVRRFEVGR